MTAFEFQIAQLMCQQPNNSSLSNVKWLWINRHNKPIPITFNVQSSFYLILGRTMKISSMCIKLMITFSRIKTKNRSRFYCLKDTQQWQHSLYIIILQIQTIFHLHYLLSIYSHWYFLSNTIWFYRQSLYCSINRL